MEDKLDGCPRCKDYDSIREELEESKRQKQKETKDSLKNCEESKKQLQKKLITIGAVAVVAATILGKDFIDKVADYINSFNSVKDAASKMTSSNTPDPPVAESSVAKEVPEKSEQKKEEDSEDPVFTGWGSSLALESSRDYSPLDWFVSQGQSSGLDSLIMSDIMGDSFPYDIFDDQYQDMVSSFDIYNLSSFGEMPYEMTFPDYGLYEDQMPATLYRESVIVPEGPAAILLATPGLLNRRRRL